MTDDAERPVDLLAALQRSLDTARARDRRIARATFESGGPVPVPDPPSQGLLQRIGPPVVDQ